MIIPIYYIFVNQYFTLIFKYTLFCFSIIESIYVYCFSYFLMFLYFSYFNIWNSYSSYRYYWINEFSNWKLFLTCKFCTLLQKKHICFQLDFCFFYSKIFDPNLYHSQKNNLQEKVLYLLMIFKSISLTNCALEEKYIAVNNLQLYIKQKKLQE